MRRRQYYGHYGRRRYHRPMGYDYGTGRRTSMVPLRGAVIVLLALAALLVLASLI